MTTVTIPQADYESTRQQLKAFIKSQNLFNDVDWEGSYASGLVDLLSFNTSINNFYRNMAVQETSRSTAQLRSNIIQRAQDNGYVARSFTCATAVVNISVTSSDPTRSTVVIPKGTIVTGSIDNRNFVFATTQSYTTQVTSQTSNTITFSASNVVVQEGIRTSDSFVFTPTSTRFDITNQQIDTSTLQVSVIENNQKPEIYRFADTVVGLKATDKVYFVRINSSMEYQIYFGDGLTGYKPVDNSIVVIDYAVSNGQLPNGITVFNPGQTIDSESLITIQTVQPAQFGDIWEDDESIRFNGDQATTRQQRSTYDSDFAFDIKNHFPQIADISVQGGETLDPPQYGTFQITAVDQSLNTLTTLDKNAIKSFISSRKPIGTSLVFADPNIIRLGVKTTVVLNGILTPQLTTQIYAKLSDYAADSLGKFNKSAIQSKVQTIVDSASDLIQGNATKLTMIKPVQTNIQQVIGFNQAIQSIASSPIVVGGRLVEIRDYQGVLYVTDQQSQTIIGNTVGSVDYQKGSVTITVTTPQSIVFDLYAIPSSGNVIGSGNTIIKLQTTDIQVSQ